jgi:putative nucleotidyltransferase with HDIG domain
MKPERVAVAARPVRHRDSRGTPILDSEARARQLIQRFSRFRTLPHVAIRLTRLLSNEETSLRKFEEVVRYDPTLTARLLRLANSGYYARSGRVESISRVLVLVGLRPLRTMVVVEALRDVFADSGDEGAVSRSRLWLHSAAVAVLAKMIARRLHGQDGEDAFLGGLLHDVGLIVEDHVAREALDAAARAFENSGRFLVDHEREHLGTDHCEVGVALAQEWRLPEHVGDDIGGHHDWDGEAALHSVRAVVQIADALATQLGYPAFVGRSARLTPGIAGHLAENLAVYQEIVSDFPDELARAREIYEGPSDDGGGAR